jgi:opacity protein-like surface antigen
LKKEMLLACLLLVALFLSAQSQHTYGVKFGLCIANQDFNYTKYHTDLDTDNRTGLKVGAFKELMINSDLSLLMETYYVQKGNNFDLVPYGEFEDTNNSITLNNRVDYWEFDALGKYSFHLSSFRPYFLGGPRIDILLGYDCKKMDSSSETNFSDYFIELYNDFKMIDFGISIGGGAEFQLSQEMTALIEVRYSPTLSNSYKSDSLKVRNSALEILTGIKFN